MAFRPDETQIDDMAATDTGIYPDEEQLLAKASEVDRLQDDSMSLISPAGDFGQEALNDAVASLNRVLPLFGIDYDYPEFDMDLEGSLPIEFVKSLMMVSQAATDAGLEHLAPDLGKIHDDDGLIQVGAQMDALLVKPVFKAYLSSAPKSMAEAGPEEEAVALPVDTAEPQLGDAEMENLFTARV